MAAKMITYEEQKRSALIGNLKRNQEIKRMTDDEVALKAHIKKRTYQEKKNIKMDRYFTAPELIRLFKVLDFTPEQKAESL